MNLIGYLGTNVAVVGMQNCNTFALWTCELIFLEKGFFFMMKKLCQEMSENQKHHYISLPLFHSILLNLQHTGISRKTPGTRRIIVQ